MGSVICAEGRFLGIALSIVEAITERDPPRRKVWETTGPQRLVVIGG